MIKQQNKFIFPIVIAFSGLLAGCQSGGAAQTQEGAWKRDGNVYSTSVTYSSPGGQEDNTFRITLENGVISKVEVDILTKIAASVRYQELFAEELPKVIVGKRLSEVGPIDRISGASLTTDIFNEAIEKLKTQVKS